MSKQQTIPLNRDGWNRISASYQAERRISTDDVHYGPLAPGERELGLLGSVAGRTVIEIGCGGGQNAIALARWGAICTGVDPSQAQLVHAHRLAVEHGVEIQFANGTAENLTAFPDEAFDIALSAYAFDYVADLQQAYAQAWRVLKPGGVFVFCLSHPWFQAVGWHLAGEPDAPEVEDYAAWPVAEDWNWSFQDGTTASLRDHLRPLAQIVNELIEAGFALEKLVEQNFADVAGKPDEQLTHLPYLYAIDSETREYQIARKLPRTLIIRARKTMIQAGT
jgi:ubiquinone/menaquinone biosynthesis C-methylase UbiE